MSRANTTVLKQLRAAVGDVAQRAAGLARGRAARAQLRVRHSAALDRVLLEDAQGHRAAHRLLLLLLLLLRAACAAPAAGEYALPDGRAARARAAVAQSRTRAGAHAPPARGSPVRKFRLQPSQILPLLVAFSANGQVGTF